MTIRKQGRIAFITTQEYRDNRSADVQDFIWRHLYPLCTNFDVVSTGGTAAYVRRLVNEPLATLTDAAREAIEASCQFALRDEHDLELWRQRILDGVQPVPSGISGMIEITYELVEGRLNAVIHLSSWMDVAGKPDSMVLRREANVHDVLIASDIHTARAAVAAWSSAVVLKQDVFQPRRKAATNPLDGITDEQRVIALIAHDGMKLEMCRFVVENIDTIFSYDIILTTGTTGDWVEKFALAARKTRSDTQKVRRCNSGPKGGDVQIAMAMVRGICRKVIFLQDPLAAHAHATDIHLFEQAVLLFEKAVATGAVRVEFATNVQAAKVVLESRP